VRNRSNNASASPSKCANRLPVLPELSGEQDSPSCSSSTPSSYSASSARTCRSDAAPSCSSSVSSSTCSPRSARSCRSDATSSVSSTSSKPRSSEKRRSRYGRDEFAVDHDFLRAAARDAPSPATTKQKHQSVCLSAYDIIIDITSPPSPISESPPPTESNSSSTITTPPRPIRPRDLRHMSPPRSRSPTPSLTSMSACSSNDIPTTPLTSDDEWPGLGPSPQLRKAPVAQQVKIHPFVITRSSTGLLAPNSSSAKVLEFTFTDLEEEQTTNEDEVSWYARELSDVVSLASTSSAPSSSSATGARPDSLFPPPSRGSRSRISKPLPSLPRAARAPHPQLDPTFPRPRTATSRPPRQPLPDPPLGTTTTAAVRKSLKITVPRAPPRTPLPLDVADIFDDVDAWSIFVPSTGPRSTGGTITSITELSPPRLPQTPMSVYDEYDPVELIVDYATLPSPQPSPSLSSFLPEYESDDEEYWPTEEKLLRSRWSCSTIAPPESPSASEKLRFHFGSVARRVRDVAVPKMHTRSSSEPSG
jgi:hypothetical protein